VPSLRVMLETEISNGKRRWRLTSGFLLQTAVVALAVTLPLLHTEPLKSAPVPDGPVIWVSPAKGIPEGKPDGTGVGGPTRPDKPLQPNLAGITITLPELPTGGAQLPPGPSIGSGEAPLGVPEGSPDGVPWGEGPAAPPPATKPIVVGGRIRAPRLLERVEPKYPALAEVARIEGDVVLRAILGEDGRVREVTVLEGHGLLAQPAREAVGQWVYEPTYLNDRPVPVQLDITVKFRLRR
jgi:TonB family protein